MVIRAQAELVDDGLPGQLGNRRVASTGQSAKLGGQRLRPSDLDRNRFGHGRIMDDGDLRCQRLSEKSGLLSCPMTLGDLAIRP